MNKRLISIALALLATLAVLSWLGPNSRPATGTAAPAFPLGTIALVVLGVWGVIRLFARPRDDSTEHNADRVDDSDTVQDSDALEDTASDADTDDDEESNGN